jgi:transcriptional regulator with XRE-family HTH domain
MTSNDYELLLDDVATRIARLKRRGVKQSDVAHRAGIHPVQLSQLIKGDRQSPARLGLVRSVLNNLENSVFFC